MKDLIEFPKMTRKRSMVGAPGETVPVVELHVEEMLIVAVSKADIVWLDVV